MCISIVPRVDHAIDLPQSQLPAPFPRQYGIGVVLSKLSAVERHRTSRVASGDVITVNGELHDGHPVDARCLADYLLRSEGAERRFAAYRT